jgi:hypothetical protein
VLGPGTSVFWPVVPVGEGPSFSSGFLKAVLVVPPRKQGRSWLPLCPQFGRVGVQDRDWTGRHYVWGGRVGGGTGFWLVTDSITEVVIVTWN